VKQSIEPQYFSQSLSVSPLSLSLSLSRYWDREPRAFALPKQAFYYHVSYFSISFFLQLFFRYTLALFPRTGLSDHPTYAFHIAKVTAVNHYTQLVC
jgi:hypothetical protein